VVGRKEGRKVLSTRVIFEKRNLFVLSDDSTCLLTTLSKDVSCLLAHKMLLLKM